MGRVMRDPMVTMTTKCDTLRRSCEVSRDVCSRSTTLTCGQRCVFIRGRQHLARGQRCVFAVGDFGSHAVRLGSIAQITAV